jgi:hypothetical protein
VTHKVATPKVLEIGALHFASLDRKLLAAIGLALFNVSTTLPRSNTAAAPIPDPIHMDTTPK